MGADSTIDGDAAARYKRL